MNDGKKSVEVAPLLEKLFAFWYDTDLRESAIVDDPDIENRDEDESEANILLDEIFLFPKFLIRSRNVIDSRTYIDVTVNDDKHWMNKLKSEKVDAYTDYNLSDLWRIHTMCKEDIYVNSVIIALEMFRESDPNCILTLKGSKITKIRAAVTEFKQPNHLKVTIHSEKEKRSVALLDDDGTGCYYMLFLQTENGEKHYIDLCPFNHQIITIEWNKFGYPKPHYWNVCVSKEEVPFKIAHFLDGAFIVKSFNKDAKYLEGLDEGSSAPSDLNSEEIASVTLLYMLSEVIFHRLQDNVVK